MYCPSVSSFHTSLSTEYINQLLAHLICLMQSNKNFFIDVIAYTFLRQQILFRSFVFYFKVVAIFNY